MGFIWSVLLGVCRSLYAAYSLWCCAFPFALLYGFAVLADAEWTGLRLSTPVKALAVAVPTLFGLFTVVYVRARLDRQGNPGQTAFMSWFGTLKSFRNDREAPLVTLHVPSRYLVENPGSCRMTGKEVRAVLDVIQPGDILLRGFEGYVDGFFIRQSSCCSGKGFQKGWFTHVGLYVGSLGEDDRNLVPPEFAREEGYFSTGPQMVVHAMAKGVHVEDILTFCRSDYLALLRLNPEIKARAGRKRIWLEKYRADTHKRRGQRADFSRSQVHSVALEHALNLRGSAPTARAIMAARLSALERIGARYDFDCSDQEFDRFTCAQFVYYCYRGVSNALDLEPRTHAFFPLAPLVKGWSILPRTTITPDDYYELTRTGTLSRVWEDPVSCATHGCPAPSAASAVAAVRCRLPSRTGS
jgi:hypothetical protein